MMMAAKKKEAEIDPMESLQVSNSEIKHLLKRLHEMQAEKDDDFKRAAIQENRALAAEKELKYERDRANALEQRLQRMSGYLDRVMDEENEAEMATEVVRARPAPKGPRISQINMPSRDNSRPNLYAIPGSDMDDGHYPARHF